LKSDGQADRLTLLIVTALTIEAHLDHAESDPALLRRFHEYLEDYFHNLREKTDPACLPDPSSELVSQLLADDEGDYRSLLVEILKVETRRSMLASALNKFMKGEALALDERVFSSAAARDLIRRTQEDQRTRIVQVGRGTPACPACYMSLSPALQELRRDLMAACPNCRAMLVRALP
jgi:hypothetical protein